MSASLALIVMLIGSGGFMMLVGNCCITIEIFFFVPFNAPEGKGAKRVGGAGAELRAVS